jgi:ADP-ribose pyrophosphatase
MDCDYMPKADGVLVFAVTKERNVALVEQYRVPKKKIFGLPAGMNEPDESFEDTARRELLEETGYKAGNIMLLGTFYPLVGVCDVKLHIYFTNGVIKAGEPTDKAEFIKVHLIKLDNYESFLKKELAVEGSYHLAYFWAKEKRLI